MTRVLPCELVDVISETPAITPRVRSSGVATVEAIVSGLAPGSDACTMMVGKSTCGSGATGNKAYATIPASARPSVSSVVATGRPMKREEGFMPEASSLQKQQRRGKAKTFSPQRRKDEKDAKKNKGILIFPAADALPVRDSPLARLRERGWGRGKTAVDQKKRCLLTRRLPSPPTPLP